VRASPDEPFSEPSLAPVIDSPELDSEPFVTPDGCELFFASTRAGGKGSYDLYRSQYVKE
jgi:hypothetical protein